MTLERILDKSSQIVFSCFFFFFLSEWEAPDLPGQWENFHISFHLMKQFQILTRAHTHSVCVCIYAYTYMCHMPYVICAIYLSIYLSTDAVQLLSVSLQTSPAPYVPLTTRLGH